jgi:hypothetical protein
MTAWFGAVYVGQLKARTLIVVIASDQVAASTEPSSKSLSSLHRGKYLGLDLRKYFKI